MRLIDADAFFAEFPELRDYEYASQEYEIDAIPIEWLENWKRGKTSIEQVVADKIMMDYKYRDWEKENANK